jgi:hypothetical protein
MTADEFLRFERLWKMIFCAFVSIFIAALLDQMTRQPSGIEAFLCYSFGSIGFLGCIYSARRLGDPDRLSATKDGLDLIGEDLSVDLSKIDD